MIHVLKTMSFVFISFYFILLFFFFFFSILFSYLELRVGVGVISYVTMTSHNHVIYRNIESSRRMLFTRRKIIVTCRKILM